MKSTNITKHEFIPCFYIKLGPYKLSSYTLFKFKLIRYTTTKHLEHAVFFSSYRHATNVARILKPRISEYYCPQVIEA